MINKKNIFLSWEHFSYVQNFPLFHLFLKKWRLNAPSPFIHTIYSSRWKKTFTGMIAMKLNSNIHFRANLFQQNRMIWKILAVILSHNQQKQNIYGYSSFTHGNQLRLFNPLIRIGNTNYTENLQTCLVSHYNSNLNFKMYTRM